MERTIRPTARLLGALLCLAALAALLVAALPGKALAEDRNDYNVVANSGQVSLSNLGPWHEAVKSGPVYQATTVYIKADDAPTGKVFDHWFISNGSIPIDCAEDASTSITLPIPVTGGMNIPVTVTANYAEASIIEGADPAVQKGKTDALRFKTNIPKGKITGVKLDDTYLTDGQYTLAESRKGMDVVLQGSFVADLSTGEHRLVIENDLSTLETTITVESKHSVYIEQPKNGRIDADHNDAAEGKTVKFQILPNEGYEIESFAVVCGDERVDATLFASQGNAKAYQFTMPEGNVLIRATLKKAGEPTPEPTILDGNSAKVTAGSATKLAFRSSAPLSEFIRVELDGATLDSDKFALTEGSTIVTLNEDFVAALSEGEHKLGIVSQGGTATANFTIEKAAEATADAPLSKTGDAAPIAALAIATIVSAGAIISIRHKLA